jgi:ribonuclease P protein component
MIDKQRLEQAALYAADVLDPADKGDFEHELRLNPELRSGLGEMQDIVAILSRTATQVEPPVLDLNRITRPAKGGHVRRAEPKIVLLGQDQFTARKWLPWALAAACAIVATWFGATSYQTSIKIKELQYAQTVQQQTQPNFHPQGGSGTAAMTATTLEPKDQTMHSQVAMQTSKEVKLIQDRDRLKREIAAIHQAHAAQTLPQDGVLQMKLIEMRTPGTAPKGNSTNKQLLDVISDAMLAQAARNRIQTTHAACNAQNCSPRGFQRPGTGNLRTGEFKSPQFASRSTRGLSRRFPSGRLSANSRWRLVG